MSFEKIAFVASSHENAQAALADLRRRYGCVPPGQADVIVALGGDGFMLETLHRHLDHQRPIYGMNRGTVGFLMNAYQENGLIDRIGRAEMVRLHPLAMRAMNRDGTVTESLAFNEVALVRQTRQSAKIRIRVDGTLRLGELICDGVLVATAAGSTAYNFSAHGPIIPMGADVLALTPISAFRPRRWRGALLAHRAVVEFEVVDGDKRAVSATADFTEVRDVREVEVWERRDIEQHILFDPEHNLEERILGEQFSP